VKFDALAEEKEAISVLEPKKEEEDEFSIDLS